MTKKPKPPPPKTLSIETDTIELDETSARALFADYASAIEAAESNDAVDGVIDLVSLCSGTMRLYSPSRQGAPSANDEAHENEASADAASAERVDATANAAGDGVSNAPKAPRVLVEVDALALPAESPSLFINGDLKVNGLIEQHFRGGFLVVFGNVEAVDMFCGAQIFITGSLTVKNTIFGNCTNYPTLVLGPVKAKTLISAKEHYFCFYGGRSIKRIVDAQGDTPNLEDAEYGVDILVHGIDGGHDNDAVLKLLRRGKPLAK